MSDVTEYGTLNAGAAGAAEARATGSRSRSGSGLVGLGSAMAAVTSIIALAFSGYSFYETVLKQADFRVYPPPLIYMYRQDFRDVLAIPVTIANDGAVRGTVLSFDLEVMHRESGETKRFQNLHFGTSPKGDVRLFTPVTVQGRETFTDVVLFHALKTGAFFETTGGVKLPLRLTLTLNIEKGGDWPWLKSVPPAPVVFDMTANYIQGFRDMEAGRPTRLHDERWTGGEAAAKEAGATPPAETPGPAK